ncbi:MAG: helix-turn-helix domain-containing protein [Gemmatimonadales bacterium]|nr:helix-turn-helix domain-containing protein [Gemmatimonadales bacterium]NIN13137.1 helix-turn-helix domain-containing protein [Gemmatimonadales bacterium]NIN51221.1 helix-turn-helix domain-containing protein [Gemmatimonadales bacterium]NIP08685.1 helix-turn-helix domain-containing protein [Gemmatimonadales bacterium]NIR02373.1 helix-turn-helix domain-containing protein [Gemmatimonadales bacterium]
MAVIPVVHRNGAVRAAIRRGLPRRGFRVVACRSLERAVTVLRRELVDAVVVDVRNGLADGTFQHFRGFPRIPIFALSAFRPDDGALIMSCRRSGVCALLVEGVDDPALGELIAARCASRVRRAALADGPRLLRLTEPVQLRTWEEVLARAGAATTTADIARALRRTREHLSREFAAGGAPNLKRVIDLARVAWAADLLVNPGYSVTEVAKILGYASASHLTGSARRVAGVTAVELGRLGPHGVLQRFAWGRTRSRLR